MQFSFMLTLKSLNSIKIFIAQKPPKSLIDEHHFKEQCASWLLQRYANEILINGFQIKQSISNPMLVAINVHGYIMRSEKWIERCLRWPSKQNTFRIVPRKVHIWAICYRLFGSWMKSHKFTRRALFKYFLLSEMNKTIFNSHSRLLVCHNYSLFNYFIIPRSFHAATHQLSNCSLNIIFDKHFFAYFYLSKHFSAI